MTDHSADQDPAGEPPQDWSSVPPLPPESSTLMSSFRPPVNTPGSPSPTPAPAAAANPSPSVFPAPLGSPAPPAAPSPTVEMPLSSPTQPQTPPQSMRSAGWSALGATPSTPPVRPAPAPGATQYLPPVEPPNTTSRTALNPAGPPALDQNLGQGVAQSAAKNHSRWGWRALLSFLAGGLIAAGGFGAAQLTPREETVAAESAPTTVTTAATRDSGTVPVPQQEGVAEPAAFVAEALGPSVVQIETGLGVGSGVIFGDGLVLTNNHVVEGALRLTVKLADGSVLPATVLGTDVNTDVAVVSVGAGLGLPVAQLATGEKARVGQVAIAIGSPFDLQQSVTAGIVSAVDRPIQNTERSVVAMIQTDAPINPGNSGGALADRYGRVIGINTSIQTDGLTAANVGVGFAVPIDTAIRVADLLVAGEPILPGFLGVSGIDPVGGEAGVELSEITAGSAADLSGLRVGDRVLSLDGAPVIGFFELAGMVVANQAGDTVSLEIIRDGELVELEVTLGERGPEN